MKTRDWNVCDLNPKYERTSEEPKGVVFSATGFGSAPEVEIERVNFFLDHGYDVMMYNHPHHLPGVELLSLEDPEELIEAWIMVLEHFVQCGFIGDKPIIPLGFSLGAVVMFVALDRLLKDEKYCQEHELSSVVTQIRKAVGIGPAFYVSHNAPPVLRVFARFLAFFPSYGWLPEKFRHSHMRECNDPEAINPDPVVVEFLRTHPAVYKGTMNRVTALTIFRIGKKALRVLKRVAENVEVLLVHGQEDKLALPPVRCKFKGVTVLYVPEARHDPTSGTSPRAEEAKENIVRYLENTLENA